MQGLMKRFTTGGLAAALIAGGLFSAAPPASAGCLYGGWMGALSRCDGPVQPDGTWQRCVVFETMIGGTGTDRSTRYLPSHRCEVMGPDQHPWGAAFNDPPTHIDA
jgi:hypothetical protein